MGERNFWEHIQTPSTQSCCYPERWAAIGPALRELFSCPAHFPMSLDDKCSVAWHRVTSSSVSKCLTHRCVRGVVWSCMQLAGPVNHHQARESQWAHSFLLPSLSGSSLFGSLFWHWFHSAWYYQEWSVFLSLSVLSNHCEIELRFVLAPEGCSSIWQSPLLWWPCPQRSRAGPFFPYLSWPSLCQRVKNQPSLIIQGCMHSCDRPSNIILKGQAWASLWL